MDYTNGADTVWRMNSVCLCHLTIAVDQGHMGPGGLSFKQPCFLSYLDLQKNTDEQQREHIHHKCFSVYH